MTSHSIKKIIGFGLLFIVLAGFANFANAQTKEVPGFSFERNIGSKSCGTGVGCWISWAFSWGISNIIYWIGWVGAIFLQLAGYFFSLMITFNALVIESGVVKVGFDLSLQTVNLFFVLVLIFIAIATMLRVESYGAKKLLGALIMGALLVNFSLVIAGVLLDFSHVLTKFFLSGGNEETLQLGGIFNPQQFISQETQDEINGYWNNNSGADYYSFIFTKIVPRLIFVSIFTWMLAIIMMAVAVTLIVRFIYLIGLLALMPFIWIFSVIPELNHLSKQWWDKFFKQVFYLPAVSFFIYLAFDLSKKINKVSNSVLAQKIAMAKTGFGFGEGTLLGDLIEPVVLMFVVGGLLIFGLIISQQFGVGVQGVANYIYGKAKGAALGTAGVAVRSPLIAGRTVGALTPTFVGKGIANKLSSALSSAGLRWIPGAKSGAAALAGYSSRKGEVDEYQKQTFEKLNDAQFSNYMSGPLPVGAVAQSAMLKELIKRKKLNDYKKDQPDRFNKLIESIKSTNAGTEAKDIPEIKEVLGSDPTLSYDTLGATEARKSMEKRLKNEGISPEDAKKRADSANEDALRIELEGEFSAKVKPDKATDLDAKSVLSKKTVVTKLNNSVLSAISRNGSDAQQKAIKSTLEDAIVPALKTYDEALDRNMEELAEAKLAGDKNRIAAAKEKVALFQSQIKGVLSRSGDEEKRIFEKYRFFKQNIKSAIK